MYRIGQSSDIHRFIEGNFVVVGGEKISAPYGVDAHSDGDALLHAISEAMLGALAMKDLGTHFPDTDDKYKGMSSLLILKEVYELIKNKGYEINNIDSLVMIEKVKMAPHLDKIVSNIANVLNIETDQINVKATRGEKIGFIGREEGYMAQAIVLLQKK